MLLFLRHPRRDVGLGREPAPLLLATGWEDVDEAELAARFRKVLQDELHKRRADATVQAVPAQSPVERLRHDLHSNDVNLALLSVVWAYYVERLSTKDIADVDHSGIRNIQRKLELGRKEVAALLALRTSVDVSATPVQRDPRQPSPIPRGSQQRNRRILIERVRKFWIAGVLKESLYDGLSLKLSLRPKHDAVLHPWETWVQPPHHLRWYWAGAASH
jgi:hypothetical protein